MTTNSVPAVSEIPQHLKATMIRVLQNRGISMASVASAAVGIAVVELSRTHNDIVIDETNPIAEALSWMRHRPQINFLVASNFVDYSNVVKQVYEAYVQEQAENFIQNLAESLFGPNTEVKSWSLTKFNSDGETRTLSGNNSLTEEPTPTPEEHDPETCPFCRDANNEARLDALDAEAQVDNVVSPPTPTTEN